MGQSQKCSWDDTKEEINFRKHKYAFNDLDEIFDGRFFYTAKDNRRNYGEERYNSLVEYQGHIIIVTFTPRAGRIRLISVRRASREERKIYHAKKTAA